MRGETKPTWNFAAKTEALDLSLLGVMEDSTPVAFDLVAKDDIAASSAVFGLAAGLLATSALAGTLKVAPGPAPEPALMTA